MGRLLFVVIVWSACSLMLKAQDFGTIQMLLVTEKALIGSNFTLICAWEPSNGVNVTYVNWIGGQSGLTFIMFNTTKCDIGSSTVGTSNLLFTTGYRYQTLTFVNATQELNGSELLCLNDIGSSLGRSIIVDKQHNVRLRPLSPTTWYGSNFTFICSYDREPGIGTSRWYSNGQLQFSLSKESCSPVTRGYTFQCTKYQHMVTLTDVTKDDNGDMWQCFVAQDSSNKVRATAFKDPGWPDGVELHTTDAQTSIAETPTTLICSSRCEDESYEFRWNISSGNVSQIEYNSCLSTCTQKITFEVGLTHRIYIVKCTVLNNRTGKNDSKVIKLNIALPKHVTTKPFPVSSDHRYIYIGVGSAICALFIVVCIVVVFCCKRKAKVAESDEVMTDHVLYTSAKAENSQSQEKLVMEDNVLYGYGCSESTHTGNNPVMEENVLYESSGETDRLQTAS